MKIVLEWFLLDNACMNLCIYLTAAAMLRIRPVLRRIILSSVLGSVYAALSLFCFPILNRPLLRILCFLLLGVPMQSKMRSPFLLFGAILLSAALVGGIALLITLLTGGSISMQGTMVSTVTLRTALITAALSLIVHRTVRDLRRGRRESANTAEISVRFQNATYQYTALADSGNLLTDPLTGLPIVLLAYPRIKGRPVPIHTANGAGTLSVVRCKSLIFREGGRAPDCCIANPPAPTDPYSAIIPLEFLSYERRNQYAAKILFNGPANTLLVRFLQKKFLLLYAHQGKSSFSAVRRGGSTVH